MGRLFFCCLDSRHVVSYNILIYKADIIDNERRL